MKEAHKPDLKALQILHAQFVDASAKCEGVLEKLDVGDTGDISLWLVKIRENVRGMIEMSNTILARQVVKHQQELKQRFEASKAHVQSVEDLKKKYREQIAQRVTVQAGSRDEKRVKYIATMLANQTRALQKWAYALLAILKEEEDDFVLSDDGESPLSSS